MGSSPKIFISKLVKAMIWKSGELIQNEKYLIEIVLGMGGFGITYLAKDLELNRLVAIKTANEFIQSRPNFAEHQEKFVQEAFRLAKCQHSHIVNLYEVCQEAGLWCAIVEYITGSNLEQLVLTTGVLPESIAILYIQQIGSALSYLHERNVLHRDVKPSNVMLREDSQEAVLIDFGLAREFVAGKIMTHTNARTESFAPIEQYQERAKRGAYTDVYALAATFYYLLTGQQPLPAQFRLQGTKLIPPQHHNPLISNEVNLAIVQGMALEPERRPQSIAEWLNLFREHLPTPKISYQRLEELLAAQDWQAADEETYEIMLKVTNRVKEGWLDYAATSRLPCQIIQKLDELWQQYSQCRFGFSPQKQIWQELGGKIDYRTECLLGERLGWRSDNRWRDRTELTFSLEAPIGHLPWDGHLPEGELKELGLTGSYSRWWCCLILSRCAECGV
jgi:serine/threonine protein kinase